MGKMQERCEGEGVGRGNPSNPHNDSTSVRIMPKFKRPFGPFAGQLPVGPKSE